jgi:NADPH-dependent ferric siderophore reductase
MASLKSLVRDKLSQLFFNELTVESVRDVTPHFRQLQVAGDWLRTAQYGAGDKLQIMIAEAGPRTYTPFAHDTAHGRLALLAYVHGTTPGAVWMERVRVGQQFRAFGPRGSLPLGTGQGPVVFVGDETSIGAAAALHQARAARDPLAFVFECTDVVECELVLSDLGIAAFQLVARQPGSAHLAALTAAIRRALGEHANAQLVLTGHAQTIQGVRGLLKQEAVAYGGQKVKAYWADGKKGLD